MKFSQQHKRVVPAQHGTVFTLLFMLPLGAIAAVDETPVVTSVSSFQQSDNSRVISRKPSQVTRETVTSLYLAFFNRSPDSAGLDFWVRSGATLEQITKSFFDQPETKKAYPSNFSDKSFVTAIYFNVLERAPDTAGLNFWVKALEAGVSRDVMILEILNGAQGDDLVRLDEKVSAALSSDNTVKPTNNPLEPVTATIPANISSVSANPQTVKVGEQMTFSMNTNQPADVDRVEVLFTDAEVTEEMTLQGSNTRSRSRVMSREGHNRPFTVKLYRKSGGTVEQSGTYTIQVANNPPIANPVLGTPQNLSVRASDKTVSILGGWVNIDGATGYDVCQAEVDISNIDMANCTAAQGGRWLMDVNNKTERKIDGLINGKTYYFRIVAKDSSGKLSAGSPQVTATPYSFSIYGTWSQLEYKPFDVILFGEDLSHVASVKVGSSACSFVSTRSTADLKQYTCTTPSTEGADSNSRYPSELEPHALVAALIS